MKVQDLAVHLYRIPMEQPEADGTLHWEVTTVVVVEAESDSGARGIGYSYASSAAAPLIRDKLAHEVIGCEVDETGTAWARMVARVRNIGRPGIAATAISAVDTALWDLKAKVAGSSLCHLLGTFRDRVPIYGSGGFTSYSDEKLLSQLCGWAEQGIPRLKMKLGTGWGMRPEEDIRRVKLVREAIGPSVELFVDANGAYSPKQAIRMAHRFADFGVSYFEEPVSSDHLHQLAFVRQHAPMAVAAGEYGYGPWYFRDMLQAGAVDILQADITRCLGVTGWLQAATLAYAFNIPFSGHTAPSLHAQVGCSVPQLEHVEYFYDHARIEQLLFEGAPQPEGGYLKPAPDKPGFGLELKRDDAEQWRITI